MNGLSTKVVLFIWFLYVCEVILLIIDQTVELFTIFVCAPSADKLTADRVKAVMEHIWKLQEFVSATSKLSIDQVEFAYLKTIVLFSPGECTPVLGLTV